MSNRLAIPLTALAAAALLVISTEHPLRAQGGCSLTNATTWCVHQDSPGVSGGAEDDDRFGAALALGDFNGDGFDDLAVGAPGENNSAGFVYVFYSNGLVPVVAGHQLFSQDTVGGDADGGEENGDLFGFALAAGDFNHDGFDDLAVGSPEEDLPEDIPSRCLLLECEDAGGVHVIYGAGGGLQLASSQFFDTGDFNGDSGPGENARGGWSLAVADFSPVDGIDDLAVGAPQHFNGNLGDPPELGVVYVAYGAPGGLNGGTDGFPMGFFGVPSVCGHDSPRQFGAAIVAGQFASDPAPELAVSAPRCPLGGADVGAVFYYDTPRVLAPPDLVLLQTDYSTAGNGAGDHFGAALAAGDFDGNGFDDLAAGAPNKDHGAGSPNDSGRVYVAYSSGADPDPADAPDIIGEDEWADTPGAGERFGSGLAAGDVDGDGFDDLLAGAPGEGAFDVGRVYLKRGSAAGLTSVNNALFTQTALGGSNGDDDHLGNVIALGDVDGDGELEVALGVPDKEVGATTDGGMVYVTRILGNRVFGDGFESGNKAAWSASTP